MLLLSEIYKTDFKQQDRVARMKRLAAVMILMAAGASASEFPAFMTGHWRSTSDGVTMEEQWLAPAGGVMLGVHRDVRSDGRTFFEFLRVEVVENRLVYLAMPGARQATAFPMKSLSANKVIFENLQHDFPQRIIYWLRGKSLCARVEGAETEQAEQWCWDRVGD